MKREQYLIYQRACGFTTPRMLINSKENNRKYIKRCGRFHFGPCKSPWVKLCAAVGTVVSFIGVSFFYTQNATKV